MAVDRADDGDPPRHAHDLDNGDLDSRAAPGAERLMLTDPELRAAESRRYHAIADQSHTPDGDLVGGSRSQAARGVGRAPRKVSRTGTRSSRHPADGSWGTATDRMLTAERNAEATRVCAEIRHQGKEVILPAMKRIEAAEPQRYLAGLEHMLKGEDRLKEKAAELTPLPP